MNCQKALTGERLPAIIAKLFLKDLLDIADLLLDLAADLLILAFSFEVRVIGGMADLFLDRTLRVVNGASNFIFCAVFHWRSP
jgi:hypothetical protein